MREGERDCVKNGPGTSWYPFLTKIGEKRRNDTGLLTLERLRYCIFTSHAGEILEVKGLGFLTDLLKWGRTKTNRDFSNYIFTGGNMHKHI